MENNTQNGWLIIIDFLGTLTSMTHHGCNIASWLDQLRHEGFEIVIATGSHRDSVIKHLTDINIPENKWPSIIDCETKNCKESWDAIRGKTPPALCVVIDDGDYQIETAGSFGMHTIQYSGPKLDEYFDKICALRRNDKSLLSPSTTSKPSPA